MGKRRITILIFFVLFFAGLCLFLYPWLHGATVDHAITKEAVSFLQRVEQEKLPVITLPPPEEEMQQDLEQILYPELYAAMENYNKTIYAQKQKGLSCEYAYQNPSFVLADFGLDSEVFGVLSIPAVEIEMPIYLGATYQHMADGTSHMSQTSLPIGGENTNCVIAGHRGWKGAAYFRYIDQLAIGDEVTITNLWETLTYTVAEIKVILPDDVDQILIQEGRELLTLLTCHPYASGGQYRYLVICERNKNA